RMPERTNLFNKLNELSDADLKAIPAKTVWQDAPEGIHTALDVIHRLKEVYTQSLAYEFSHIQDSEERAWLHQMVESNSLRQPLSNKKRIARNLQQLLNVLKEQF
ncbi:hypothetical protein ACT453_40805, partial [Bacillus sp. D-CC]